MKPYLQNVSTELQTIEANFGKGLNQGTTKFNLEGGELFDCSNVTSKKYPSIQTRDGISAYTSGTSITALGERDATDIHYQDGSVWKKFNGTSTVTVKTGLSAVTKGTIISFNIADYKYTLLMNGTDRFIWDGSTVTELTEAPATNLVCAHDSSAYAVLGRKLYVSKLGDVTEWNEALTTLTTTITNSSTDATAIIEFDSYVYIFSLNSMHILLGTDVENFKLTNIASNVGCVARLSPIVAGGKLMWLWYDGVYQFSGSMPQKISKNIDTFFETINMVYVHLAVSGSAGKRAYWSVPTGTSTINNKTIELNLETGKWYVHNIGYSDLVTMKDSLYGVAATAIVKLNSGTLDVAAKISWSFETGMIMLSEINKFKKISDMLLLARIPQGSIVNVAMADYDGTIFDTVDTIAGKGDSSMLYEIKAYPYSKDKAFRLKFFGIGEMEIHALHIKYRMNVRDK